MSRPCVRHILALAALLGPLVASAPWAAAGPEGRSAAPGADVAVETEAATGADTLPLVGQTLQLLETHYLLPERIAPADLFRGAVEHLAAVADDGLYIPASDGGPDTLLIGHRTVLLEPDALQSRDALAQALAQVASFYRQATVFHDIEGDRDLEYTLIRGMLGTLDHPTRLLVDTGLENFQVRSKGSLIGVGMVLRIRDGRPYVREVVEKGPSERGGILAGDRILRIDGESTLDMPMSEVVGRLRGDLGTEVSVEIARPGRDAPLTRVLARARVKVENVKVARLDGGVGYLEITNFSDRTLANFRAQLQALEAQGKMTGLVLDLRANRGGSLRQSAYIADQFVQSGLFARTVGHDGERVQGLVERLDARPEVSVPIDLPVVVLVSPSTASGAEILAGALKYHDRALIVGQRTFGKGTVQKVYDLDPEARLKATVARYLIEGDHWLHGVGLEPDVELGAIIVEGDEVRFAGWGHDLDALDEEEGAAPDPFQGDAEPRATHQAYFVELRGDAKAAAGEGAEEEGEEDTADPEAEPTREQRLMKDQAVRLASRVILETRATTRSAQLKAVGPSVAAFSLEQEQALVGALTQRGIDWSAAPPRGAAEAVAKAARPRPVDLTLRSGAGPDWVLTPGEDEIPLSLTLTSGAAEPLHRVRIHTLSEDGWLRGHDFVLGKVEPGSPSVAERTIRLPYRAEPGVREVRFAVFADELAEPLEVSHLVTVLPSAQPELRARVTYVDGGVEGAVGDGDGIPEAGETLLLTVQVENLGEVPTGDVSLQLRNPLRKDVEIRTSQVTLDPIAPGATALGHLAFEVRAVPEVKDLPPVAVEMLLRDRAYGVRIAHELVFETKGDAQVAKAAPWHSTGLRLSPPHIALRGGPPLEPAEGAPVAIRAVAVDDTQVRVLSLYADQKKMGRILGGGAEGGRGVTLTQELDLEEGSHLIELVAEDDAGLYGRARLWVTSHPSVVHAEADALGGHPSSARNPGGD